MDPRFQISPIEQKAERLAVDLNTGNERDASNMLRAEFMYNPNEALAVINRANQIKNPMSVENVVQAPNGTEGIIDRRNPQFFDAVGRSPYMTFQGYPGQNYPVQSYPGQHYPIQSFPIQNHPGQNYPVQNYPVQNYPVQNYPVQNYPVQNYPVQNYPGQNYPPGSYPPGAYNPGVGTQPYEPVGTQPVVGQQPVVVENNGTNPGAAIAGAGIGGFLGALLGSALHGGNRGYGYPVYVPPFIPHRHHR